MTKKQNEELAFYRSLTVSRDEGMTSIDDGKTAKKLHTLWEDRERFRATLKFYANKLEYEPWGPDQTISILEDLGAKARATLEAERSGRD